MKKKIFILLLISFILFFLSLFYYHKKEKEFSLYLKKIQTYKTNLETKKLKQLSKIKIEKEVNTWAKDKEKILENIIANQLTDFDTINEQLSKSKNWKSIWYQKLYLWAMRKKNNLLWIKAIKLILKTTKNKDVWLEKIVDLYIKVWDFKNAEKYSQKLLELKPTKDNLKKYLYIRFQNVNFFDKKEVSDLKNLIKLYYDKKIISSEDFTYNFFLIDLLYKWDIKNLETDINMIVKDEKNDLYKSLLNSIKKDLKIYKSNKGSPLYYFKSLVALDLLKYGYFWLAKNIAEQVYIQDGSYILPQQILAYSYFYMWNFPQAIKYFQLLKKNDKQNKDDYNFFLWISYYWTNNYENTLIFLSLLKNNYKYNLDILRYKLLSYLSMKNSDNIISTINEMTKYKLNYVDYYNIFKYLLFKCKTCYKDNQHLVIKLIKNCYKQVDRNKQYVCWYAKANLYRKAWYQDLALKYNLLLTQYFHDSYIYDFIANYYDKKWDIKKARLYYLKELLYTSKEEKRVKLKEKIKNLYLKSKK